MSKKDIYKTPFMQLAKKIAWITIGKNNSRYLHSFLPSQKEKQLKKKRHDFYMQFLAKGDTYFDIGANYGNRIEPIIDEELNIIAVEPQEECINVSSPKRKWKLQFVQQFDPF